ncbi:MAG TPA: amidohydrolase family protein, partial [Spirochaetota bacterium]
MRVLIINGRLINPSTRFDGKKDILIEDGIISQIADRIESSADTLIDARGQLVLPGLIDIHVHLRQPGREDLETIVGGAEIAAASGFTTICAMPNTTPPPDSPETIQYILDEGRKSPIEVLPVATITQGRKGVSLADMELLAKSGASSFSDDGSPVNDSGVMRKALEESRKLNLPVLAHEEDFSL